MAPRAPGAPNHTARIMLYISPERAYELGRDLAWLAEADVYFNDYDYRDGRRLRPAPSADDLARMNRVRTEMADLARLLKLARGYDRVATIRIKE